MFVLWTIPSKDCSSRTKSHTLQDQDPTFSHESMPWRYWHDTHLSWRTLLCTNTPKQAARCEFTKDTVSFLKFYPPCVPGLSQLWYGLSSVLFLFVLNVNTKVRILNLDQLSLTWKDKVWGRSHIACTFAQHWMPLTYFCCKSKSYNF